MRVCIVNNLYYPNEFGGAERSCKVIAEELAKDHDVHVYTTSEESGERIINEVNVHYRKIYNVYWSSIFQKPSRLKRFIWHLCDTFNVLEFFRFCFFLYRVKPDLIHFNNVTGFSSSIVCAAFIFRVKAIVTLRDFYFLCSNSKMKKGNVCVGQCSRCKIHTLIRSKVLSKVDMVVGNSQFMLDKHVRWVNDRRSKVIYNGWDRSSKISDAPINKKRYGYIGALNDDKGLSLLINAFEEFSKNGEVLYIAGAGKDDYLSSLKCKIKGKNNIILLGVVVPDEFYSSVDWVVVPSIWNEPLARVVFESYFYSTPVIVSDAGGNPEAVDHKLSGLIFKSNDRESLIKALSDSAELDYVELSKYCFEKSFDFKSERVVAEYFSLYKGLIDETSE